MKGVLLLRDVTIPKGALAVPIVFPRLEKPKFAAR
jgi:hypothetical protein